jgi:hypothetical protein
LVCILRWLKSAGRSNRTVAVRLSAAILVGWFLLALALALGGFYQVAPDGVPTIQYGLFIPILIGAWLIWRSSAVGQIIDAVPQPWIVGVQLYRALGVIFPILYVADKLSGLFAWPAGIGDVVVGLSAPLVALAYARNPLRNAGRVKAWNRSHCRGHDWVHHDAFCTFQLRTTERADQRLSPRADPGLSRAALNPATSRVLKEATQRNSAHEHRRHGVRMNLVGSDACCFKVNTACMS